ncbi:MAG: 4-alpha-glucanotransferase [Gammaproteobacteria bacterium]|nr:4-alpha-glucanotransferase [Gammaproteobacteria bacterium]
MGDRKHSETLPAGRSAGVCLHLTSLPGPYGIGEIGGDAIGFVDAMRRMGLTVWQFLPTGPTAFGDSPYQPLSTFAGNEMLIDLSDLVARGLLQSDECRVLAKLPTATVDYAALIPAKFALLKIAASRFADKASGQMKTEFDEFLHAEDALWLRDFALYRVLKSRNGERPWHDWDARFVHREAGALQQLEAAAGGEAEQLKIIQFLFRRQWRRLRDYANSNGISLFGDMPIYIALDSADAWANPEILEIDRDGQPQNVAGVPPDYFSADGQLWGNPLYAWQVHAANDYRWWVERLRAASALVDIVRIDHFRGFEAYWSVPSECETARDGAWVAGPGDAIFESLRRQLGHLPIVAENLGVITPEVEALRHRYDIPGMTVLQFDVAGKPNPLDVEENCVCYTGTHDNDTTVGWFHGSPDDIRSAEEIRETQRAVLALTGGTPDTIHTDLIRCAFSTRARLAIAPLQDFLGLGSDARSNIPGTSSGNWRWRFEPEQLTAQCCDEVAMLVADAGRR